MFPWKQEAFPNCVQEHWIACISEVPAARNDLQSIHTEPKVIILTRGRGRKMYLARTDKGQV